MKLELVTPENVCQLKWKRRFLNSIAGLPKKTAIRVSKKGKHLNFDCMVTWLVNGIQRVQVQFYWFSISTIECSWTWSLSSFFTGQCLICCCWALNDDIMIETRCEYQRPEREAFKIQWLIEGTKDLFQKALLLHSFKRVIVPVLLIKLLYIQMTHI